MYDPTIGQFISEDPIKFDAGDPNLRRYVGNSPTNATDPSGLEERKPISITFLDRDEFESRNPAARHRFFRHRYDSWHYGVTSDQQIFDILGLDPDSVTTRLEFTNFYANERHPYVSIRGKDKQGNSMSYCAAYEGVYNGKPLIGYTFYHTPGHLAWELTGIDKLQALQTIAPYYGLGGGTVAFAKLKGMSVPLTFKMRPVLPVNPGTLTAKEMAAIQSFADKYDTVIEVVGSRAARRGRNVDTLLPKGKAPPNATRSDIDFRIDHTHPMVDDLIRDLKSVGCDVGSASTKHTLNARETYLPLIRFTPRPR